MSKKITVTPAEVRGWGNLIGEKSVSDYTVYEAEVTSASETVDSRTRTVFTVTANITSSILSLAASSSTIDLGQSVTLSGTLLDADSSAITGATVKIYLVDSSTPVTVTTGSGGAFSTTVTPSVGGVVSYYAVYDGDSSHDPGRSSNVNITVNKLTSTLSLSAVSPSITVGSSPQLTGTLKHSSTGLTGKSVRIYRGTSLVDTVTTTTGGAFSFTDEATSSTGFLTYYAVFEGDSTYTSDESDTVEITVADHVYNITCVASSASVITGGSVIISGVLKRDNVVYSGQTVTVFKNDGESVSYETTTTDSSGAYSVTFSNLSIGEITFWASGGPSGVAVSDTVTVTVSAHTYSLTAVASSQSITEGQSVTISGVYKEDNTGYSGQSITVYYQPSGGQEFSTTTTTGSGGAYSVTLSGFIASGSPYTVWADAGNVESSDVEITVSSKPVPTLSLSAVSSSIVVGDTPQLTGTLSYSGSGLTGKSVKIYRGSTLVDTVTTGSGGSFSFTDSATSSVGTLQYKAVFDGDSSYASCESSTVSITVSAPTPADLVVTGTKSILSYADSESCVLTATVTDSSDNPLSGQTVVFKNGSTTLDTKTTDSNGQCTYTYASTGAGDVTITVECSLLQETYELEDCYYYDPSSSSGLSKYTTEGLSFTYDTTQEAYQLTPTSNNSFGSATITGVTFDSDIHIKADISIKSTSVKNNNNQFAFGFNNLVTRAFIVNNSSGTPSNKQITLSNQSYADITATNVSSLAYNTWYSFELAISNGSATLTLKQGDTSVATITGNVSSLLTTDNPLKLLMGYSGTSPTSHVRNIKVKAL